MGRGQQTLPRYELQHQGPHAAVNQQYSSTGTVRAACLGFYICFTNFGGIILTFVPDPRPLILKIASVFSVK